MAGIEALYIHIPFCAKKCAYCDFSSWAHSKADEMASYVDTILAQLDVLGQSGMLSSVTTAYVGGGTPSVLSASSLSELAAKVCSYAPLLHEFSFEANPESLHAEKIAALKDGGATRISLGVQALDDAVLQALGRIHLAHTARKALELALASSLNVSADLMCALPQETEQSFAASVEELASSGISHASIYPLQIEKGTSLEAQYGTTPKFNDPDIAAARMLCARDILKDFGFSRYEVASYAQTGKECDHNKAYWSGKNYLGLGIGAASMVDKDLYSELRHIFPQLIPLPYGGHRVRLSLASKSPSEYPREPSKLSFIAEFLTLEQTLAEDLMLAFRMVKPLDSGLLARVKKVLGAEPLESLLSWAKLEAYLDDNLVQTDKGWLLGNAVYGRFLELAPTSVKSTLIDGYNPQRTKERLKGDYSWQE